MEFHPEANQVEYVICPARIDAKVAESLVLHVFNQFNFFAVEMFQTEDDEILVNEVSRPHNSGHYSIELHFSISKITCVPFLIYLRKYG
jgi:5-(carboxyamino)imidazole ribonucleotide synthase